MTLSDKEKYTITIDNLKLALKHGIKLKKIHRTISFKQKPYLKKYIDSNTKLRSEAATNFRKNLYKLMNNIIFGRSIINKRKYITFKLLNLWKAAEKCIAQNNFHRTKIFSKNLVGFHLKQEKIVLDTLPFLGSIILENSKNIMQRYHYEFFAQLNANLIYTDTDSLIYEIFTDNVYEDFV